MRITTIETIRLEEFPNLLWVHVGTDEGLTGLGENPAGRQDVLVHHFLCAHTASAAGRRSGHRAGAPEPGRIAPQRHALRPGSAAGNAVVARRGLSAAKPTL